MRLPQTPSPQREAKEKKTHPKPEKERRTLLELRLGNPEQEMGKILLNLKEKEPHQ